VPTEPHGESSLSAPWGAAAAFSSGIAVLVLGAGNSASFLALLPGLSIMAVSGGFLFKHMLDAPKQAAAAALLKAPLARMEAPLAGMLMQAMQHRWLAVSFSVALPFAEAQRLREALESEGEASMKVRAFAAAVADAGWLAHRAAALPSEASMTEQLATWKSALDVLRSQAESGYRGAVLASQDAPKALVTWTLGLLVVGAIPKRSGAGALRLQWWLEEFVATGTEVVESDVVLVQNAESAALLACVGDVIQLDPA
jgi:hypothetical protein